MRVLHYISDWKWTGPVPAVVDLVAALRSLGVAAGLAGPPTPKGVERGTAERARAAGVPYAEIAHPSRLIHWCARHPVDVLHVHQSRDHLWAAAARGRARLVRSNFHGRPLRDRRGESALVGRCADGYVTFTRRGWERDSRAFPHLRDRSLVAPPGMDLAPYARGGDAARGRAALGVDADDLLILTVARVQAHRRIDILLEAMARVVKSVRNARLAVVGRGTRLQELAVEPARELGLGRHAIFPGYVGDGYLDVVAAADIFVYMAPGSDGTARALREAMALGRACVGANVGMVPELLEGAGLVFPHDAARLAETLLRVAADAGLRRALGASAREKAVREFRIRDLAARVMELYERVLAKRGRWSVAPAGV